MFFTLGDYFPCPSLSFPSSQTRKSARPETKDPSCRVLRNSRSSLGFPAIPNLVLQEISPFPIPVCRPVPPPPGPPSSAALPGRLGGEGDRFRRAGPRSGKLGRAPRAASRDRAKAPRDPRHRLGAAPAALSPVSPSPGDAPTPGDCRSPRRPPGGFWGGRRQGTPAGWPLPAPSEKVRARAALGAPAAAGAPRPGQPRAAPRSPAPAAAHRRPPPPAAARAQAGRRVFLALPSAPGVPLLAPVPRVEAPVRAS